MQNCNKKFPLVLCFMFLVGALSIKDVGFFVNDYNTQLNNGNKIEYKTNDRVQVIGEGVSKTTYHVKDSKNDIKFYVPKGQLLKVHDGVKGYIVKNNTPLYINGRQEISRLLFVDEYLEFIEDKGDKVLVKTEKDGIVGTVSKLDLTADRKRNIVDGLVLNDYTAIGENGLSCQLIEGDRVDVAWFQDGKYIVFDDFRNKFFVDKEVIDIFPEETNIDKDIKLQKTHVIDERIKLSTADNPLVDQIINRSMNHLGRSYVYGDTGEEGFDCSGLIYSIYEEIADITLPRSSKQMATAGESIELRDLKPGDLLFFDTEDSPIISHVAMYIGNGEMIHASNTANSVKIDPLEGYYFQNNFVHAQRIIN